MDAIYIDSLVIGGTFFGLGYASVAAGKTLIVEPGIRLGNEYSGCYHPNLESDNCETENAKRLLGNFRNKKVSGKFPIVGAYSPLLSKYAMENKMDIRLCCQLLECKKNEGGYSSLIHCAEGVIRVYSKHFTDTLSYTFPRYISEKAICSMIYTPNGLGDMHIPGGEWFVGERSNVAYLRLSILPVDNWTEARARLYRFWENRPLELKECRIISIGTEFYYRYAHIPKIKEWHSSLAFDNAIKAFDMGVLEGGADFVEI